MIWRVIMTMAIILVTAEEIRATTDNDQGSEVSRAIWTVVMALGGALWLTMFW